MRHITDGELHAYLDGALDLLPQDRGDEIRDHLGACSACGERLQDEEELREAAHALLARAAPAAMELPSFESLRAQAEAREANEDRLSSASVATLPRRRPLRGLPLAWAATVVLALGVGWMGGELWRSVPGSSPALQSRAALRQPGAPPPLEPVPGADRARLDVPPSTVAERAAVRPGEEAREVSGAGAAASSRPAPPTDAREERLMETVVAGGAGEGRQKPSVLVPSKPSALPPLGAINPLAEREASVSGRALASPEATSMQALAERALWEASQDEALRESSLAVPGLEVLSVEWEEWIPGERALRIRQLISQGDTLELRYLGMLLGTDPEAEAKAGARPEAEASLDRPLSPAVLEASLPPGWNQVEMRWGRGWLVARAPLPEASLRMLLRSIR